MPGNSNVSKSKKCDVNNNYKHSLCIHIHTCTYTRFQVLCSYKYRKKTANKHIPTQRLAEFHHMEFELQKVLSCSKKFRIFEIRYVKCAPSHASQWQVTDNITKHTVNRVHWNKRSIHRFNAFYILFKDNFVVEKKNKNRKNHTINLLNSTLWSRVVLKIAHIIMDTLEYSDIMCENKGHMVS